MWAQWLFASYTRCKIPHQHILPSLLDLHRWHQPEGQQGHRLDRKGTLRPRHAKPESRPSAVRPMAQGSPKIKPVSSRPARNFRPPRRPVRRGHWNDVDRQQAVHQTGAVSTPNHHSDSKKSPNITAPNPPQEQEMASTVPKRMRIRTAGAKGRAHRELVGRTRYDPRG